MKLTLGLLPFTQVATPEMMAGTQRMYENMNEWEGQVDPGFTDRVFQSIRAKVTMLW